MPSHLTERLSYRCDREHFDRVEAARGRVARERFLRDAVELAVEQALETEPDATPARVPAERRPGLRSSAMAKANVQPIPRGMR